MVMGNVELSSDVAFGSAQAASSQWCGDDSHTTSARQAGLLGSLSTTTYNKTLSSGERTDRKYAVMIGDVGRALGLPGPLIVQAKKLMLDLRKTKVIKREIAKALPACLLYVARNNDVELPLQRLADESRVDKSTIHRYVTLVRKACQASAPREEEFTCAAVGNCTKQYGSVNLALLCSNELDKISASLGSFLKGSQERVVKRTRQLLEVFENEWSHHTAPRSRVLASFMIASESEGLKYKEVKKALTEEAGMTKSNMDKAIAQLSGLNAVLRKLAEQLPWLEGPISRDLILQNFDQLMAVYASMDRGQSPPPSPPGGAQLTKPEDMFHVRRTSKSDRRREERASNLRLAVAQFKSHCIMQCGFSTSPTRDLSSVGNMTQTVMSVCLPLLPGGGPSPSPSPPRGSPPATGQAATAAASASGAGAAAAASTAGPVVKTEAAPLLTLREQAQLCTCSLTSLEYEVRAWFAEGLTETEILKDPSVNLVSVTPAAPTTFDLRQSLDSKDIADDGFTEYIRTRQEVEVVERLEAPSSPDSPIICAPSSPDSPIICAPSSPDSPIICAPSSPDSPIICAPSSPDSLIRCVWCGIEVESPIRCVWCGIEVESVD